jgi:uncharacterized protein (TIGR02246 family)
MTDGWGAAELALLIAERGVRALYARYCDAVWRRDSEAFVGCFAHEAVWKVAGLEMRGPEAIRTQFEAFVGQPHQVMMFTGLPNLDIAGDEATSRIAITEYSRPSGAAMMRTLGVYYVWLVRDGKGVWRFSRRHLDLTYMGAANFVDASIERPDYGPPPAMPLADAPTLP